MPREYFDKTIEDEPDNEDYWASKGTILAGLGRHEEAIECFDRTLALDHDFVAVLDEHLPGQAGRVRKYRFSTIGTYKLRVSVHANLAIVAKKDLKPNAIQGAFRSKKLTLDKARENLHAFILTRYPKSAGHARIGAKYKKRWVKETEFCDENALAPRWRTSVDHSRLIGEAIRALVQ